MKRLIKLYMEKPELVGIVFLILLGVIFEIRSDGAFLNSENLRGILGLLPEMGLVAIGVTLLMISGEFDLSVGSTFAFAPMFMAVLLEQGWAFGLAFPLGLLMAMVIGLINGILTIRFDIPSFIATLGMLFVVRSLTIVISGGFPPLLPLGVLPKWLFTDYVGPYDFFRMSVLWFVAIAILVSVLLSRTNLGNWIRATGGFLPAAQSMGIPTAKVKIACFVLCSLLAGFAGCIQVMRLGAPLPSIGEGMELQAVAAAVIGGTALTGGIGTILGGIVGAILIRVIDNGLVLSRVDANWFKMAIGLLTIIAVVLNAWLRKRAKSMKVEV
ncbi:putative ABC-type branched-chain amino acid transport system, permease component [Vibrio nigripulchritudo SO65]|uniref:Xylose transport system permease protein XylH n=1 Tax=Vibrio nigripulchritudo SOn1 TaxID=1238450 RepID=A0AAV2VYW1_9VIBR|nr:ABC transporter permease [Vibrio nigripulchritudo]CCN36939.1 putative ABC-type branched-chain amino acid transport system, permease component [Vibrio nigripulchritudo AM115]CCN41837.1 putative ABC-type branched-chain amino acid transport system, permease component [Vibrio nigripulchritudo FTn2]CCN66369.1 putative ABC-type branched-chain amino acid transport system, permease component [Vibrio nigripulchritudo POn4]CCN74460.1 putative ABC-type branched-chain amino acid transport system, permea